MNEPNDGRRTGSPRGVPGRPRLCGCGMAKVLLDTLIFVCQHCDTAATAGMTQIDKRVFDALERARREGA